MIVFVGEFFFNFLSYVEIGLFKLSNPNEVNMYSPEKLSI